MSGNSSTNQAAARNDGDVMEHGQNLWNLIKYWKSHNENTHLLWCQSTQWLVHKCTKTAPQTGGQETAEIQQRVIQD